MKGKNELGKIEEVEKMVNRENLCYEGEKNKYNLQQFDIIKSFARKNLINVISFEEAGENQVELLIPIIDFKKSTKPKNLKKTNIKKNTLKSVSSLFDGREVGLHGFKSGIFPIRQIVGLGCPKI